jgi:N-acetylglutamate synthase-like GNAT family acetyltransferase
MNSELQVPEPPSLTPAGARERLERIGPGAARDSFLPLLQLADESEPHVRSYYQHGVLFLLRGVDRLVRGVTLAVPHANSVVELKAVAVANGLQGRGIGRRMVEAVLADLRFAGIPRVIVGTASCAVGSLAFYQKVGFRMWRIERDFFTAARGYAAGRLEDGIPLRDMVWMDQGL